MALDAAAAGGERAQPLKPPREPRLDPGSGAGVTKGTQSSHESEVDAADMILMSGPENDEAPPGRGFALFGA